MIVLFLIWKGIDFLTSFFSIEFIKNLGQFPYQDLINSYHIPAFLTTFANFDGAHYISIARQGYAQFEQAFFPLYPLLIKISANLVGNNELLAGIIISNIAFLTGLFFFKKYLDLISFCHCEERSNEAIPLQRRITLTGSPRAKALAMTSTNIWPIIFILTFPTSFFFGTVYTEGLFFMFVILTFYFLKKGNILLAGLFGFFASLTRLVGIFLIIPIIVTLLNGYIIKKITIKQFSHLAILFPFFGLALYSIYLWQTTGDPLYFFHAQSSFGLNRSTNIILFPQVFYRYFKIFITAQHNFQYFIALFEFVIFSLALIILTLDLKKIILHVIARERNDRSLQSRLIPGNPSKVRLWLTGLLHCVRNDSDRLGLNLFSFSNLMLATFTGTFLSIPRFALLSLSIFIFLGGIKNKSIKIGIACIFILLHIIVFSFFARGYFVS